jgi:hypothetical protein
VTDLISYPAQGLASGNVGVVVFERGVRAWCSSAKRESILFFSHSHTHPFVFFLFSSFFLIHILILSFFSSYFSQIRDMSLGLLRGTVSLCRNLIFVLTDVVSKITLGATRGLDPIIMYVDEYTSFRPRDGLLQGIATGISEAVTTPTRSVSERGLVRGLVPGLFAGLLGLFLKPLGGALYTSGATCLAIQQFVSPEALGKRLLQRERPPRYFAGPHAALRPYRRSESEGEEYLSRVDDGRYRSDEYVLHVSLPEDMIILLTQRRLILIHGARAQFCRKSWVVCLGDIVRAETQRDWKLCIYHFPVTEFNAGLSSPFDRMKDSQNEESREGKSGLAFVFVRHYMLFENEDQMKLLLDALKKFGVVCS